MILRKIYTPKCEQGVWRVRSNLELQNAYKSPGIVTEIKIRRLKWLGHIIGMEDTGIQEMILNAEPVGRRETGRPKLRWSDDVHANMKTLGIESWRLKGEERKEWMVILGKTKSTLRGP
jgi:hypothetical protein